jgi:hypothetical protein
LESRKHKEIATAIARIKGTEYRSDKGVDVRTDEQAIEVEIDKNSFGIAKQQLAGSTRTPYIAVPNKLVKEAVEYAKGTRFGVMNERAKIIKTGRSKS